MRILLLILCCLSLMPASELGPALPDAIPELGPEQRLWCLATCALAAEDGHHLHHSLALVPRNSPWARDEASSLRSWWRIRTADDLQGKLTWLWEEGHRHEYAERAVRLAGLSDSQRQALLQDPLPTERSARQETLADRTIVLIGDRLDDRGLLAWDLVRYCQLIRSGYACKLIDEDEAWRRLHRAATLLQDAFPDWRTLGEEYLLGRAYWSPASYERRKERSIAALQRLTSLPHSPWQLLPWDLDLQAHSGSPDPLLAFERASSDAEEPDALACWRLAMRHEYGLGVKKSQKQAFGYYRKAADAGDDISQFMVGIRIEKAQGTERDFALAMHYYQLAAEQGHGLAALNLGFDHWAGRGAEGKNYEQAVYWYGKAAEQGNYTAMMNLGVCHYNGQGVKRDLTEARKWYAKAAEAGGQMAQRCKATIAEIDALLAAEKEQAAGAQEF